MAPTHVIDGDVRDPRTALGFATSCRSFNDAVRRELEILAARMRAEGLGPAPLGEISVLEDAARTYSLSNQRSVKAYAEHVVTQTEISMDADVRDTVRRTYLDTRGAEAAAPAAAKNTTTRKISAADISTPAAAARFLDTVASAYAALQASVDLTRGNHQKQGVTGPPIAFLGEQLQYATILCAKARQSAATFRRHAQKMNDTVGKDPSLHGTQKGRYLDPSKA